MHGGRNGERMLELNKLYLMDCMDGMREFSNKFFELAIVDPPYGININMNMGRRKAIRHQHAKKKWDTAPPKLEYFTELFRVSQNQIIWGGNYFNLPISRCWIFWDKLVNEGVSFSDGELAWTSFDTVLRKAKIPYSGFVGTEGKIHPTQKPVALYRWLLKNYAKSGDKILDTHVGSASSLVACIEGDFEYCGFELDADYHAAASERIEILKSQGSLFEKHKDNAPEQLNLYA
jgi:site-specific DNA-methyltransferase (adenine-specific)